MASKVSPQGPDYGNWVSWKLLLAAGLASVVLFALSLLFIYLVIGAVLALAEFVLFAYGRYQQSPRGGNVQAKLWDSLVERLDWDGHGRAIDIGCGNGPVAIRVAKRYPGAEVVGVDVWGTMWEYSKAKCDENAKAEKVGNRVLFQMADAAKLPFEDGAFDAAVSNDVFHNVRGVKDKRAVLKEALRVVKKGGSFSFQDGFTVKRYYHWEADELVGAIRSWGVANVSFEKLPYARVVGGVSAIWGVK
ncbi:MAG TPA: class I SAM-dependent methyltransferase [Thermoplasmata archaeon]|nr:class I SAM-dependent methyltransferase [Thermoplasmata archaeon]